MKRRLFMQSAAAGAALLPAACAVTTAVQNDLKVEFSHGVASGDPQMDAVILWVRLSCETNRSVAVTCRVYADETLSQLVVEKDTSTNAAADYCAKLKVDGLQAGQRYFYQFEAAGVLSPVGRTQTLPGEGAEKLRIAVVSCSNYPAGFFNTYRDIVNADNVDLVIHLGDYFYEYGADGYGGDIGQKLGRVVEPAHEVLSLDDYRKRHAFYRQDPDLMALHAKFPMVAIWDDHEVANDSWREGAENHQEDTEGPFAERRLAALQAYNEWMPITFFDIEQGNIFRSLQAGDLLALHLLDTRLYGRDKQLDESQEIDMDVLKDPKRTLMGQQQEAWLNQSLQDHQSAKWQVIGQQVLLAPLVMPDMEGVINEEGSAYISAAKIQEMIHVSKSNPPFGLDVWSGYPAARYRMYKTLAANTRNAVVLTGDIHTAIASTLQLSEESEGLELVTTSVTSPGLGDYFTPTSETALADAVKGANPQVKHFNGRDKGWLRVEFTREQLVAEFNVVSTVYSPQFTSRIDFSITRPLSE